MAEINPRNTPIALILAGAIIISAVVSAYAYGQRIDTVLTTLVAVGFAIGFISILAGAGLFYWERSKYYERAREIIQTIPKPEKPMTTTEAKFS